MCVCVWGVLVPSTNKETEAQKFWEGLGDMARGGGYRAFVLVLLWFGLMAFETGYVIHVTLEVNVLLPSAGIVTIHPLPHLAGRYTF